MKNKHKTLWRVVIAMVLVSMVLFTVLPSLTFGAEEPAYDLSVNTRGISFSPESFFAGDTVRIYGTIENIGAKDMTGYVQFSQGPSLIGTEIPVSSKAIGAPEEVWVDWVAQEGAYNIQFRILGSTPQDQNLTNNQTVSRAFTVTKRPPPPEPPKPAPTPAPVVAPAPVTTPIKKTAPVVATPTSTSTKKVDPRVLGEEKELALAVAEPTPEPASEPVVTPLDAPLYADNGASVSAVVPETPYNKVQKPWISFDFLKALDPYLLALAGSVILVVFLLLLALFFWKKAQRSHGVPVIPESKKRTPEQTLKDFLAPDDADKS